MQRPPETLRWHYLSFSSDNGFLGPAVVRGTSVEDAIMEVYRLGIRPGGRDFDADVEAIGGPIPDGDALPEEVKNRLLSYDDIARVWPNVSLVTADADGKLEEVRHDA